MDAASAISKVLKSNYTKPDPINIATGKEVSINEIINIISLKMGFKGKITHDISKPNGQPVRVLNITKAKKFFDFEYSIGISEGIIDLIQYYKENKEGILNMPKKY